MRIGSLFSGVGLLELGLERAGLGRVVWQCEIDAWCRAILARHWPAAERHQDVRSFKPSTVDIVCGGFPCQPVSIAGRQRGPAAALDEIERLQAENANHYRRVAEVLGHAVGEAVGLALRDRALQQEAP